MQCSAINRPVLQRLALPLTEAYVASEALRGSLLKKGQEMRRETLPASGYPQIDMARCWSWPCVSRRADATSPGSPSARIHQRHSTSSDTRPWNSANFPHYSPRHIRKCLSKRLAPDTLPETRQPRGTFLGELSSACFISSPRRAGALTSVFQRPSNIATRRASRAETIFFCLCAAGGR